MAIEIKSPTFPESVADGTVANWVKKEGDQVNQDEIIAEIETENQEGFEKAIAVIRKLSRVVSTMTLNVIRPE